MNGNNFFRTLEISTIALMLINLICVIFSIPYDLTAVECELLFIFSPILLFLVFYQNINLLELKSILIYLFIGLITFILSSNINFNIRMLSVITVLIFVVKIKNIDKM